MQQTLTYLGERLLDRFFVVVPNHLMAWANPDPERGPSVAEQYRVKGVRGSE